MSKRMEPGPQKAGARQRLEKDAASTPSSGAHRPLSPVPGYLSVKEAAQWIGVSDRTIYGYVKAGKLKASCIGSTIVVDAQDIGGYRRRAPGRLRTRIPPWHVPPEENLLYLTIMTVQLRPGQRERLRGKLLSIHALGKHLLPGTAARYIGYNCQCPDELQIVLVWRAAILPSEEERRAALTALRDDLAECVAWETAISQESQVIIHACNDPSRQELILSAHRDR